MFWAGRVAFVFGCFLAFLWGLLLSHHLLESKQTNKASNPISLAPEGSFCPERAIQPATCDYDAMIGADYEALVVPQPTTVLEAVYWQGQPLGGNVCPE